eukprot:282741-Prymnesium_polylepis.2
MRAWRRFLLVTALSQGCGAQDICNVCTNTCHYPADAICDDGGPGFQYDACLLGTDCDDCGARCAPPTPPTSPPSPPIFPPSPPLPPATPVATVVGACVLVGDCIHSLGYPTTFYGLDEQCTVTGLPSVPAEVISFDVEADNSCACDHVTIMGSRYCGTSGPVGVVPTDGRLEW